MEIIDAVLNPYHISNLKKQLDKENPKHFFHDIDDQCLITLLEYHSIKRDTKTRHKSKYTGVVDRVQSHKDKFKKETNYDTFKRIH